MQSPVVSQLLHQAAEEIRKQTKTDAILWNTVPYWALEANGTLGWSEAYGLTYSNGLYRLGKGWPARVYVECSTGRLVVSDHDSILEASDDDVIRTYIESPELFDVVALLVKLKEIVKRPHTPDTARNSLTREDHRQRYNVTERWDRPAEPIRWVVGS